MTVPPFDAQGAPAAGPGAHRGATGASPAARPHPAPEAGLSDEPTLDAPDGSAPSRTPAAGARMLRAERGPAPSGTPADPAPSGSAPAMPASGVGSGRGVRATWWYTVGGVVFFNAVIALMWVGLGAARHTELPGMELAVAVLGIAWFAALSWLVAAYPDGWPAPRGRTLLALTGAVLFGGVLGVAAGSALLAVGPLAATLAVLPWAVGIRHRITLLSTAVMVVLTLVDVRWTQPSFMQGAGQWMMPLYTILLPLMSVSALWWWDVVARLDAARLAESELAATRERLRLANDVHDLQGHHLQVIALQLELAERLLAKGKPAEAAAQVSAARASVDEARQGTRDLAARFRGVPLADELGNAADLLRAAGLSVELEATGPFGGAPREVLGPIIRESTTNILKHRSGPSASLGLRREGAAWVFEARNASAGGADGSSGAGLRSIGERASAAGGAARWSDEEGEFVLTVRLPGGDEA